MSWAEAEALGPNNPMRTGGVRRQSVVGSGVEVTGHVLRWDGSRMVLNGAILRFVTSHGGPNRWLFGSSWMTL